MRTSRLNLDVLTVAYVLGYERVALILVKLCITYNSLRKHLA
jgi:hypothetical protein